MKKQLLIGSLIGLGYLGAAAQDVKVRAEEKNSDNGTTTFAALDKNSDNGEKLLKSHFKAGANTNFSAMQNSSDEMGFTHTKYQQYFKGVKVEHGNYILHTRNSQVETMNGDYKPVEESFGVIASSSQATALTAAQNFIGASEYMWNTSDASLYYPRNKESFTPQGQLVIVENFRGNSVSERTKLRLAYKFDIYATEPLSRQDVYVDAATNQILFSNKVIKHAAATATFATRYSGSQSGSTDSFSGSFRLRDVTRGMGVETYNMRQGRNYSTARDFTDANNNWTAAEFNNAAKDNAALDAHLGATKTYDYFKMVHNRNSYNNANAKIKSYIHYSRSYVNAFWNGSVMTYGDGDGVNFAPLTSQDVCSHEIGHAVCETSANLVYSYESGALNEALSDIWGNSIEKWAFPAEASWYIGEKFDIKFGKGFRNMANPNEFGDPDTYLGTNWYTGSGDNGGVHYNSGVLNYCYYLLVNGGAGTNDKGNAFNVVGISLLDAGKIIYRMETVYMTSTTNYAGARTGAIQAAKDLFGAGSQQEKSTTNAFYAVGVGAAFPMSVTASVAAPTNLTESRTTETSFDASWKLVNGAVEYDVEIWDGKRWNNFQTTKFGNVEISGLTNGLAVTWRVIARDKDGSEASSLSKFLDLRRNMLGKLAERNSVLDVNLYPNPSNEFVRVSYQAETTGQVQVQLVDLMGRVYVQEATAVQTGENQFQYRIGGLKVGNYLLKVTEVPEGNAKPKSYTKNLVIEQ